METIEFGHKNIDRRPINSIIDVSQVQWVDIPKECLQTHAVWSICTRKGLWYENLQSKTHDEDRRNNFMGLRSLTRVCRAGDE